MTGAQSLRFSQRAAAVGEGLWPATVRIGSADYAAECPRPAKEKVGLKPGYEEVEDSRVVRVRKALLATAPAMNSFVTMDGAQWQIRAVGGENANDAQWVLSLEKKR